ncbi:MAG: replication restart helicase PriA [Fimbriimonadales bacterium]
MRVAEVVPDIPASGIAESYTYAVPGGMNAGRGDAVLVPFGPRVVVGYVLGARDGGAEEFAFKLREISSVIDGLSLPEELMRMLDFIADEYLAPPSAALAQAIPPGLRSRLAAAYSITGAPAQTTSAQAEVLRYIKERGGWIGERSLWAAKALARSAVKALVTKGALKRTVELAPERKRFAKVLVLGYDEKIGRFLEDESKKKPAQAACLLSLRDAPSGGLSPGEIASLASVTSATVAKLADAGLLVEPNARAGIHPAPPVKLTEEQAAAADAIVESIRGGQARRFLLFGVTGSGKTEVYLRAVAEALEQGKRVLYLVPEIALTAQVVGQLRERFGPGVAVMHSGLAEGERLAHWRRARTGDSPVVIGARSAIFAPLTNIGLIVVDEEHEGSYKQDKTPRYHLRDLAEFRAKESEATLVLGSATPSVETYYRAEQGEFELLTLKRRAAALRLPDVTMTDLREVFKEGRPSILGPQLRAELDRTLADGHQAILFINRRAYAHSLVCRDCGHSPRCPNCSVALTFHRLARRLRCHHCNLAIPALDTCPVCESTRLRPLGLGTEKVEEVVRAEFPGAKVARLDRDVARRKGVVEDVLNQLREGELQILVGTQMIAKGLDFPGVTLVGVIAADTGLGVPDFRSTERTFQLLTQVSGRAGRRKPGKVVIQSFQPEHPAVSFAAAQDFDDFYRSEIAERKEASYPPFTKLVNVVATSESQADSEVAIGRLARHYSGIETLAVIGPAECPIGRLNGRYRRHILLKLPLDFALRDLRLPAEMAFDRSVLITIDVNPGSLL